MDKQPQNQLQSLNFLKQIEKQNSLKEKASQKFKQGNIQEAIQTLKECIQMDDLNSFFNSTVHFNIGLAWCKLEEWQKAIGSFSDAISLNQKYSKAFIKRGDCYLKDEQFELAIKDLAEGLALEPNLQSAQRKLEAA